MWGAIKDRLVDDWHQALHWSSVQWALVGAVLLPIMSLAPELPAPVQMLLPESVRAILNGVWCIVFVVLRLTAQKKLDA